MYYYIHLNGSEYLRTRDALLASNIFSSLVQQANPADVKLCYGKRVFADSSSLFRFTKISPANGR